MFDANAQPRAAAIWASHVGGAAAAMPISPLQPPIPIGGTVAGFPVGFRDGSPAPLGASQRGLGSEAESEMHTGAV
jgi:hypothetical protein